MNAGTECPYCLSHVNSTKQNIKCDSCGAIYHQECWADNGGCCVGTCPQAIRSVEIDIQPEYGDLLVLTREAVESAIPHKPERNWNPCLRCGRHIPQGHLYCENCRPEAEGSQDAKNAGPLLITVALIVLALFWLFYFAVGTSETEDVLPPPTQQGDTKR